VVANPETIVGEPIAVQHRNERGDFEQVVYVRFLRLALAALLDMPLGSLVSRVQNFLGVLHRFLFPLSLID
jgi:hypothetical protein